MSDSMVNIVTDILVKYGERAYEVLRIATEIALENRSLSKRLPGDFDYRTLVHKLYLNGINYNPSRLLSIIEREYGIIETTYRSANQRWWRFTDLRSIIDALDRYKTPQEIIDDPEIYLIKLQFKVLNLDELNKIVNELMNKNKLMNEDVELVKKIVLSELENVVLVLKKMLKFKGVFEKEVNELLRFLKSISKLVDKIMKRRGATPSNMVKTFMTVCNKESY